MGNSILNTIGYFMTIFYIDIGSYMKIGLSMIVKNEETNIISCLCDIYDLFEDICIIDTGSSDNTISILNKEFGIKAHIYNNNGYVLLKARNLSISMNKSEWVLILDADEKISRADLIKIISKKDNKKIDGYFMYWKNFRDGAIFLDYKLFLMRNNGLIKFQGIAHATPQISIRDNNLNVEWIRNIEINHFQQPRSFRKVYIDHLLLGLEKDPKRYRYYRFLGYTYYINNKYSLAIKFFDIIVKNRSKRFPIDYLRSIMILSVIYHKKGLKSECLSTINKGIEFFDDVKNDFEVKYNKRYIYRFLKAKKNINTILPLPFLFPY